MSGFHSGRSVECSLPCCRPYVETSVALRRRVMAEVGGRDTPRRPYLTSRIEVIKRERSPATEEDEEYAKRTRYPEPIGQDTYAAAVPIELLMPAGLSAMTIRDSGAIQVDHPVIREDNAPTMVFEQGSPSPSSRTLQHSPQEEHATVNLPSIATAKVRQVPSIRHI